MPAGTDAFMWSMSPGREAAGRPDAGGVVDAAASRRWAAWSDSAASAASAACRAGSQSAASSRSTARSDWVTSACRGSISPGVSAGGYPGLETVGRPGLWLLTLGNVAPVVVVHSDTYLLLKHATSLAQPFPMSPNKGEGLRRQTRHDPFRIPDAPQWEKPMWRRGGGRRRIFENPTEIHAARAWVRRRGGTMPGRPTPWVSTCGR